MADFGGRYQRVRRPGAGAMGEVWLALDEELGGRQVAIKIMHSHMLTNSEDVARFQREMRLAAFMQHPNIMTVLTTGTDRGIPFMVMEYLEGEDLGKVPRRSADQAARIGQDVFAALGYAHSRDVIHRDIKPSNLFLCNSGPTKVTDFGIAKAVGGTKLSSTGLPIGTFAYMAPELLRGEPCRCAPSSRNSRSARCWRSPATTSSPRPRGAAVPAPWRWRCRSAPGAARTARHGSGRALGGRGMLPGRQERGCPGPLPGQALPGLVPVRHSRHARPRLARRHPGQPRR